MRVYGISVTEVPKSGKSLELFDYCKIGAKEIEHQVHEVLKHWSILVKYLNQNWCLFRFFFKSIFIFYVIFILKKIF